MVPPLNPLCIWLPLSEPMQHVSGLQQTYQLHLSITCALRLSSFVHASNASHAQDEHVNKLLDAFPVCRRRVAHKTYNPPR